MKSASVPSVNLPYASTVASFFGDQGSTQGNSFLGRMFKGGARAAQVQSQAPVVAPSLVNNSANGMSAIYNRSDK